MILDTIGQILWYGIAATPVIAYLLVRNKSSLTRNEKLVFGVLIAILLSVVFFAVSLGLFLRNGLGPA